MKKFLLLLSLLTLALPAACQQGSSNGQAIQVQSGSLAPRGAQRIVPGLPSYNPSWYAQTNVYWDPAAATTGTSDDTTCLDATHQCFTFGQILLRYGSNSPDMPCGQSIIVHKTSAQTLAQQIADPVWFTPKLCGGGQAQLVDTLMLLDGGADAQLTDAGFLTKQQDAGRVLQISGLPAGIQAGMFICDVTQGNSCAFIDSVVDAGVAKMEQPLTASSFVMPASGLPTQAENNAWGPGDTVNVFTENATGLKSWNPVAGDVSDAGMFSGGWVQFTNPSELGSGSPPSDVPVISQGINGMAGCKVDPRTHISGLSGRGNPPYDVGNYHTGTIVSFSGSSTVFGGGIVNGITANGGILTLSGDLIVHGTIQVNGTAGVGTNGVFADGALNVGATSGTNGTWIVVTGAVMYGPFVPTLRGVGSSFVYLTGWPSYFGTGGLSLNGSGTGCFVAGLDAGAITCNVPLNVTNLTTQHTLKSMNLGLTFTDMTGTD